MRNITEIRQLKAILDEKIDSANQVFVASHIIPDLDALASSVGVVNICRGFGKNSYIVIDEDTSKVEDRSVRQILLEIKQQYPVINLDKYVALKSENDLLITTDVNKDYRVVMKNYLQSFRDIIVIDHHEMDEHTIKTPYLYINPDISSASEIVATLLHRYRIDYDQDCANYLYAGIMLDTNNLTKNVTASTHMVASKLVKQGADISYVSSLFLDDFENDRKIQELIGYANLQTYSYMITVGKEKMYTRSDLAKAADYLLKFSGDASFAIGKLEENLIGISGRSKGKIHVGEILGGFGKGGGTMFSAATSIESDDLEEVSKKLALTLTPGKR